MTRFLKSSLPLLGLPTTSVIFCRMALILFAIHSFDLGQCLISYFMIISRTEKFLDTLKVWSKRDFCKFAPLPHGLTRKYKPGSRTFIGSFFFLKMTFDVQLHLIFTKWNEKTPFFFYCSQVKGVVLSICNCKTLNWRK